MLSLLFIFMGVTITNVITYTLKSIITIKGNKLSAALINAINSAVYMLLIIYTVSDLPMWIKVVVTMICNFVGVYIIKLLEEKTQKDKLWKVEATIKLYDKDKIINSLRVHNLPCSYFPITNPNAKMGDRMEINIYCRTQQESKLAKEVLDAYDTNYFVAESKTLI